MRMRSDLPQYICFRQQNGSTSIAFLCTCGEAMVREVHAHIDATGSSAEVKCPQCHKFIQVRASTEV